MEFRKLFEDGIFKKLNLGIGTLENYLKMEVLKIKFKKWNFEELFETEVLKMIKVWKVKVLKK